MHAAQCHGPDHLCRCLCPAHARLWAGRVILLGSAAYASGLGRLACYAASKAYSRILAAGSWYELQPHGVDVLHVVATRTRTSAVQRLGMPLDSEFFLRLNRNRWSRKAFPRSRMGRFIGSGAASKQRERSRVWAVQRL